MWITGSISRMSKDPRHYRAPLAPTPDPLRPSIARLSDAENARSSSKPDKPHKAPMHLLPGYRALAHVAWVLHSGNEISGYTPGSWRDVDPAQFRASAARHFAKWLDDPRARDPETGQSELAHWVANGLLLLWHGDQDEP